MTEIITTIIQDFGYIGICFLLILENLFPPIPSELILAFSGFISKPLNLNILLIIISSTLGSLIGAIILYYFGTKLKKLNIESSMKYFKEKGTISILICRFIPIERSLISKPAGIYKTNKSIFIILTTIGSLIWNSIIVLLGNMLGDNYSNIESIISTYKYVLIIILILYIIIKTIKKRVKT